jgi:hypothetical protein
LKESRQTLGLREPLAQIVIGDLAAEIAAFVHGLAGTIPVALRA